MGASERRRAILEVLCQRRQDTRENLAHEFGVSLRTISNDIDELSRTYFQIQGVVGSATRIQTGTSTASWVQLYNNYNASFPSLSVDFVGSGYFTESRTHSGGGSVNINGFNLTGSTAYTDTYSSDTMSLIWTYKLYA